MKLSVVMPFHNVEQYLAAALESLARQTLGDLEVILVDDGSTDGSALIAKSYVSRDSRFQLIEQENAGLGQARNAGIRCASGEYLAFADSDDVVSPHAYTLLTGSLAKTGSDIATGAVRRFTATSTRPARLYEGVFQQTVRRTHVSRFPLLLQDRVAWNKVYRRSFWDAHGFAFPSGLYEDAPVTVRAHVLASSVDVIADIVYYWRVRESGARSITGRYREIANIEQRMDTARDVDQFLTLHAPALKPANDATVLRREIRMLVQAFEQASDEERVRIAELAACYLQTVDASVYATVTMSDRLRGYLLGQQKLPELLEVLRFERRGGGRAAPVVRGGGRARWFAGYPFLGDPAHGIPDDMYDVTSEMTVNARVDRARWRGRKLHIEGHAYIHQVSSATPSQCRIRAKLRNSKTGRTVRLPVTRISRPDVTADSGQAAVSYEWSGFVTEISAGRLATLPGVWRSADWELRVEVAGGGLCLDGPVISAQPRSAQQLPARWVSSGVRLRPGLEDGRRFVIRVQQVTAHATACTAGEGTLDIEGWSSYPLTGGAMVLVTPRKGGKPAVRVPAEPAAAHGHGQGEFSRHAGYPEGRHPFHARIPVDALISHLGVVSPIDRIIHVHDEFTWDVSLSPGEKDTATRLTIDPAAAGGRVAEAGREVTAFTTSFGYLSLLERTLRPVITGLEWTSDGRLMLHGNYSGRQERPAALILRQVRSSRQHTLPLRWEGSTFTTEFAPEAATVLAGPGDSTPLANGDWEMLTPAGKDGAEVAVALDRRLLPGLSGYHRMGLHEVAARTYNADALRLQARLACVDNERGAYAVQHLAARFYPSACAEPLRELAVFDSFSGRDYSCNPRAIHDELRRTHPDIECAWVTSDLQFSVPEDVRLIPADSRAHFEALARARYVIVNDELPRWFRRREGQTCLQTWHGSPLKRIGLDVARPRFESWLAYPDLLSQAAANWSLLLSQNAFSTAVFRRAFGYEGEIAETGYPRNDPLHHPDRDQHAAAIRGRLGLPAGKRIVLYAPAWREDADRSASGGYAFDLNLDLSAMAAALRDHVLLLHMHPNASAGPTVQIGGDLVTPESCFPAITDLLLISDVLITDYSSVMFDFASTGRPILFYTYDLDSYRDSGDFCIDLEAEAPGPLLRTTQDVIEALRALPGIRRTYQDVYEAFARTYCALDDGKAAVRAVRRLVGQ